MDLGYSNHMINSTTGRMTTENWVNFFCVHFLSYGHGIILEKVGGIFKSGRGMQCSFPMFLRLSFFHSVKKKILWN